MNSRLCSALVVAGGIALLSGCGGSSAKTAAAPGPSGSAGSKPCQKVELLLSTDGSSLADAIGKATDAASAKKAMTDYVGRLKAAGAGGSPALTAALDEYSTAVLKIVNGSSGQTADLSGITQASGDLAKACVPSGK